MSELSEYREPVDDEAVFLQDESCVEQSPRLLHLDEVFEEARQWQAEYLDHEFTSYREASLYMKRVAQHFDLNVQSKNMMGQKVTLSGAAIEAPVASYDEVTGVFTMQPVPIESLDLSVQMDIAVNGVKGSFAGFGYRLIRVGQNDIADSVSQDDVSFNGELIYQIATGVMSHAHGYTQFFVTGNVLNSHIEFADDVKKQNLDSILGRLLTIDSLATAEAIDQLNLTLADTEHLATQLPKIVELTSAIAQSKDFKNNIVRKDLLTDLLAHYIHQHRTYSFVAPDAIHVVGGKKKVQKYSEEVPLTVTHHKIRGIVLGAGYRREGDKVIMSRSRHVPYFVIDKANSVIHVAMDRVSKFQMGE